MTEEQKTLLAHVHFSKFFLQNKMYRPQLLQFYKRSLKNKNWFKIHGCRLKRGGVFSVRTIYSCPFIIFLPPSLFSSLPPCLPASCCKPKYNIYLLSTALEWIPQCIFQISMSISDLWHQPYSLNQLTWKPPRAWTLVSDWDVRPGCFPRASPPICLSKSLVFVPSTAEAQKGTAHVFAFPPHTHCD